MKRGGGKALPREGDGLRVGLIFPSPEEWALEEKVRALVVDLWTGKRKIAFSSAQLKGSSRELSRRIREWTDKENMQVICVVGKSGHRREDFAPEVTSRLLQRTLPGIEERMYLASPRRPEDLLFRGVAGTRRETLILNLPRRLGRMRHILRFLAPVLDHALEKMAGDTSECGAVFSRSLPRSG